MVCFVTSCCIWYYSLVLPGVSSSFSSCPGFPAIFVPVCDFHLSLVVCPAPNVLTCASLLSCLPLSAVIVSYCCFFVSRSCLSMSRPLWAFLCFSGILHTRFCRYSFPCNTDINVETIEEFSARGMSEQSMGLGVYWFQLYHSRNLEWNSRSNLWWWHRRQKSKDIIDCITFFF